MRPIDPIKARVAYHVLEDRPTPGDRKAFVLTLKHNHAWKSEAGTRPDSTDLLTNACAGWVPFKDWNSGATAVTWISKLSSAKGLQPIRPVVVSKHSMDFEPKHFHKLEATCD